MTCRPSYVDLMYMPCDDIKGGNHIARQIQQTKAPISWNGWIFQQPEFARLSLQVDWRRGVSLNQTLLTAAGWEGCFLCSRPQTRPSTSPYLFIKKVSKGHHRDTNTPPDKRLTNETCIYWRVHCASAMGLFIGHSASQLCSGFSERMRELSCPLLAFESVVGGGGGVMVSFDCCPEQSSRAIRVGQCKDGDQQRGWWLHGSGTQPHTAAICCHTCFFSHFNLVDWLTLTLVQLLTHRSRSPARPTSVRAAASSASSWSLLEHSVNIWSQLQNINVTSWLEVKVALKMHSTTACSSPQ